jgi:hypothetical protein
MEIIDAQVHLNRLPAEWQTTSADTVLQVATAAMDAVGVDGILIAEGWGYDAQLRPARATILPNGATRGDYQFSARAV